jgi:hypothetical protein
MGYGGADPEHPLQRQADDDHYDKLSGSAAGGIGPVATQRAVREETLGDRIGERMRSRLAEMCVRIEMTGADFRQSAGARVSDELDFGLRELAGPEADQEKKDRQHGIQVVAGLDLTLLSIRFDGCAGGDGLCD